MMINYDAAVNDDDADGDDADGGDAGVSAGKPQTLLHLVSHPPVPPLLTCTNLTDDDNPSSSQGLENTSKGCHFANIIGSAWSSLHLIAGW